MFPDGSLKSSRGPARPSPPFASSGSRTAALSSTTRPKWRSSAPRSKSATNWSPISIEAPPGSRLTDETSKIRPKNSTAASTSSTSSATWLIPTRRGRGTGGLLAEPPEEEREAPPEVHRMLVPLDRGEGVALDLADVGREPFAEAALAVRLDLERRRGLQVLGELRDLLGRQRQAHGSVRDLGDLLGRHVARLPERARR